MSDVPIRELRRLEKRFESQAGIFPDESQAKRVCKWAQEQTQDVIDEYDGDAQRVCETSETDPRKTGDDFTEP